VIIKMYTARADFTFNTHAVLNILVFGFNEWVFERMILKMFCVFD